MWQLHAPSARLGMEKRINGRLGSLACCKNRCFWATKVRCNTFGKGDMVMKNSWALSERNIGAALLAALKGPGASHSTDPTGKAGRCLQPTKHGSQGRGRLPLSAQLGWLPCRHPAGWAAGADACPSSSSGRQCKGRGCRNRCAVCRRGGSRQLLLQPGWLPPQLLHRQLAFVWQHLRPGARPLRALQRRSARQ